ncbi:hypothetical protein BV22DRAFT_1048460 [Leucogyrophana mollusca]|uniref:Uncharacterized protein n=1 Tax=Leucogyrophana mollusca TaxID=85980 RepID=A0ACB8BCT2_9AGAM|nr:hypothetical protein BV22DRAFT_1048460 [Leucogyrophana mollusca]
MYTRAGAHSYWCLPWQSTSVEQRHPRSQRLPRALAGYLRDIGRHAADATGKRKRRDRLTSNKDDRRADTGYRYYVALVQAYSLYPDETFKGAREFPSTSRVEHWYPILPCWSVVITTPTPSRNSSGFRVFATSASVLRTTTTEPRGDGIKITIICMGAARSTGTSVGDAASTL